MKTRISSGYFVKRISLIFGYTKSFEDIVFIN